VPIKPSHQALERVCVRVRMHNNMIRKLICWCCRCCCPGPFIVYTSTASLSLVLADASASGHHIAYICYSPTGVADAAVATFFTAVPLPLVLANAAAATVFALAPLTLFFVQSSTQMYTAIQPSPQPPKHIPCFPKFGKLFFRHRLFIYKILWS